ncbi:PREDICTED: leucine-rich repeat-containing protein 25 [Elephantulus edwardii]|uniref:leucine-rich repeat-containing protein 25 n=1 Tax=Elephantulus edwardii TaxID=28737 RepID=UPI0003F0B660|nr:PREDICTED: leucine-rich repeat-containing protein 25 [Elephantulus edwardii]
MEGTLVWVLLVLLVLEDAGTQEFCPVYPAPLDWTTKFYSQCLNFSNLNLSLPQNQSLQASNVVTLDLSLNGLRELPPLFFKNLGALKVLDVTGNSLNRVGGTLAALCNLTLKADCGCGLAPWHEVRRDNCSGQLPLQCLDVVMGSWRNLSTFLEANCARGLTPGTIGALAASGCLLLGLAITGLVLAWRFRNRDLEKVRATKEDPKSGLGRQPRYSSRGRSSKAPAVTLPGPTTSTPDYENMVVGQPAHEPGSQEYHWTEHGSQSPENDFYMNYEDHSRTSQPVYCNLASLRRATLDEEEYVVPGH